MGCGTKWQWHVVCGHLSEGTDRYTSVKIQPQDLLNMMLYYLLDQINNI